jgi:DNA-binding transcriptional ArsR family regulator
LIKAAPHGLPAGDIAAELGIPNNTLSSHVANLTRAGLLNAQRAGRNIIYQVDFSGVQALFQFLLEDCCQAEPALSRRVLNCALQSSPASASKEATSS